MDKKAEKLAECWPAFFSDHWSRNP